MSLMEWNDAYSVKIFSIDSQHKNLVALVNNLNSAMRQGKGKELMSKVLQDLISYTKVHFKTEEDLMVKHTYPEYEAHKKEHDDLTAKVLDFYTRFQSGNTFITVEVMNFLRDWLVNHILGSDKKYGPFFIEKGVR